MNSRKSRTKYNYDTLIQYRDENKIELIKDYSEYDTINRDTIIEAYCLNCSGDVIKNYRQFVKTGCFCDKCKKQYSEEKRKATCLEKYGVENPKKNQRTRWNRNKLTKFCIENNVKLLRDYSNERITCDLILEGHCSNINCNLLFKKSFKHLISNGDKCSHCCIGDNTDFNIYNWNLLIEYCNKYNITLLEDYSELKLCRNSIINTKCQNCKNSCEKLFYSLIKSGSFCHIHANDIKMNKTRDTNMKKYGFDYALQSTTVKEKSKNTNRERYGFDYALQSTTVKDKIKTTNTQRYGCVYACQNEGVKEKIKETNRERYGCEYPMQNDGVKEKSKNTNREKYGCDYVLQNEGVKDKIKTTNTQRYGCENPMHNEGVKEKLKETNRERYGCEYPFQNEGVKDKIKTTNTERHGCEYPMQNDGVKEKSKNTNREKYGCDYVLQNEGVKEKIKETNREKYGCENPMQNEEVKEKSQSTNIKKYGFSNPFQNEDIKEKIKETNREKYGCASAMQNVEIFEKQQKSCFKRKEYIFPSGRIDLVQGYEPQALDILIQSYEEDDIVTSNHKIESLCGEIKYTFGGKERKYYTDIYIKSSHTFIEVKSDYTFESDKEKNLEKREACINAGINFEFWIMDKKGNILQKY